MQVSAEYAAELSKDLIEASYHGRFSEVKRLLEDIKIPFNVNAKDEWGYTALIYASREGHHDIVKFLLEHGCSASLQNMANDTALHWAVHRRHPKVVEMLVHKGADLKTIKNQHEYTPLDYAKKRVRPDKSNKLLEAANEAMKERCEKMRDEDYMVLELLGEPRPQ